MGQQTTCADGSDSHSSTLDQERTTVRQAPGLFNVFHDLLLQKLRRATKVRLARTMNRTMRPMWVRHNSPVRLTDRERRSDSGLLGSDARGRHQIGLEAGKQRRA